MHRASTNCGGGGGGCDGDDDDGDDDDGTMTMERGRRTIDGEGWGMAVGRKVDKEESKVCVISGEKAHMAFMNRSIKNIVV